MDGKSTMERRKNYYIKKEFQRNFILKFCSLVIVGAVISGIIIYAMSSKTVTTIFENSRLTIKSTGDYILPSVFLSSIVVIVVIGIATIYITLFTSHKIAGPLYRIEKDVNTLNSGDLTIRFSLRQGDEIKPLAASLDNMAVTLRQRVGAVKDGIKKIDQEVSSLPGASASLKKTVEELKRDIAKFNV